MKIYDVKEEFHIWNARKEKDMGILIREAIEGRHVMKIFKLKYSRDSGYIKWSIFHILRGGMDALLQESDEVSHNFSNSYLDGMRFVKMIKDVGRPCIRWRKVHRGERLLMLRNNSDARENVYKQAMYKFGHNIRNLVGGALFCWALQGWGGLKQFERSGVWIHSPAADQGCPHPLCNPW